MAEWRDQEEDRSGGHGAAQQTCSPGLGPGARWWWPTGQCVGNAAGVRGDACCRAGDLTTSETGGEKAAESSGGEDCVGWERRWGGRQGRRRRGTEGKVHRLRRQAGDGQGTGDGHTWVPAGALISWRPQLSPLQAQGPVLGATEAWCGWCTMTAAMTQVHGVPHHGTARLSQPGAPRCGQRGRMLPAVQPAAWGPTPAIPVCRLERGSQVSRKGKMGKKGGRGFEQAAEKSPVGAGLPGKATQLPSWSQMKCFGDLQPEVGCGRKVGVMLIVAVLVSNYRRIIE